MTTHDPITYTELRNTRYERQLKIITKAYRPDFVIVKTFDSFRSQGSTDEWKLNRIESYRLASQDLADAKVSELQANPGI